jgi:hypothetical protein
MAPLSLKKILILGVCIALWFYRKAILEALAPMGWWFRDSLDGLYDFPKGAQTAIAFLSIVLVVVLIAKHFRK